MLSKSQNSSNIRETSENTVIEEVDVDVDNNVGNPINLKKSSEVYYEIYRAAKQKAKHMREMALKAYLEAEQIKMKFSLDDIDEDSDSESESEYDSDPDISKE